MGTRISIMATEVRGNALATVYLLTPSAARQRHLIPGLKRVKTDRTLSYDRYSSSMPWAI